MHLSGANKLKISLVWSKNWWTPNVRPNIISFMQIKIFQKGLKLLKLVISLGGQRQVKQFRLIFSGYKGLLDRNMSWLSKRKQLRQKWTHQIRIPNILPEETWRAIWYCNWSQSFERNQAFEGIFPPERTLIIDRQRTIWIVTVPHQLDPRNVMLIEKLMQML